MALNKIVAQKTEVGRTQPILEEINKLQRFK